MYCGGKMWRQKWIACFYYKHCLDTFAIWKKDINIFWEQYHPPQISLGDANSSARAFDKENELAVGRRDLHQTDLFAEPDKSAPVFSD